MSWVIAAVALWLLPGVLALFLMLVLAMREQFSRLVIDLQRRQAREDLGDERGASGSSG